MGGLGVVCHLPSDTPRQAMRHSITLNVRYDQPQADWEKVGLVFESMPGWRDTGHDHAWFGAEGEPVWI